VLEYSYDIADTESEYRVEVLLPRAEWRKTTCRGTVQIDPETADVVFQVGQWGWRLARHGQPLMCNNFATDF
jgi:hypothetical protein